MQAVKLQNMDQVCILSEEIFFFFFVSADVYNFEQTEETI